MQRTTLIRTSIVAALIALLPAVAISQGNDQAAMHGFMDANNRMMQGMGMKMSGDPDKDFVMMMIPHHQGAIDMAKVELKYGKDPKLRSMAENIIKAQEQEIAEMKEWQKAHP